MLQTKITVVEKLVFGQVFKKEETQSMLHEPSDCAGPHII